MISFWLEIKNASLCIMHKHIHVFIVTEKDVFLQYSREDVMLEFFNWGILSFSDL